MSAAFRSVFNVARTARVAPVAASARSVAFARPAFVYRSYSAATGLSKDDIQTRVLDVIKSFEKVDPTKVKFHAWVVCVDRWLSVLCVVC